MPTVTGRATSFIQFTRASNATVTDSSGFIEWAGHNLLTNSESFDASGWTKSSATVTANTDPAPNGTTTGDTIAASGANGTALQTWTAEAVPYTFGVWLRRKTGTGTIEIAADSGTYTAVTITSSWALYTVTQTPAAGSKSAGIRIVTSADEVYAWGAHLYRSDLGGMVLNPARGDAYYPTTPPNLLGFTESLTTGWTNSNTTDSIVTETNPNGLANSVEITATAGNGTLLGSLSLLASPYTFSIYLKRKTGTGTVEITVDGTTYVAAAVTGTWTRFSTTLTPSAGTKTPGIRIVTSGDAVYAWGAQISSSASLDTYSPVYGAAVTSAAYYAPRLDFDPVTLAAKGLLVEEQRANLLTDSAAFGGWSASNATVNTDVSTVTAPDGTTTADRIVASTSSGYVYKQPTVTSGTVYTFSVYLKNDNMPYVSLAFAGSGFSTGGNFANFNLQTGTVVTAESGITASIQDARNGWYRCVATKTASSSATADLRIQVSSGWVSGTADKWFAYGAQLEAGSFATSYIPTGAASATRSADVASVSTQAFPYSATEGTIVANGTFLSVGSPFSSGLIGLSSGTYNESISLYCSTTNMKTEMVDDAVLQSSYTVAIGAQPVKAAFAYAANNSNMAMDGVAQTTDVTCSIPTMDRMTIGSVYDAGLYAMNGWIRQVTYLPRRLSNAELQARTI